MNWYRRVECILSVVNWGTSVLKSVYDIDINAEERVYKYA